MNTTNLVDRQKELEQESVMLGMTRYRAERLPWQTDGRTQKAEADLTPGKMLLKTHVEPLAEAIGAFIEAADSGKAGRKHTTLPYLAHIDATQAAYLALRFAMNGASAGRPLSSVARAIGDAVQEHLEMLNMAAHHAGLYRKLTSQLASSTSSEHRLGVIRNVRRKYGLNTLSWSVKERVLLGMKLLELAIDTTGLFEIRQMNRGRNDRPQMLMFTAEAREWLEAAHGRCELLSPIHLPMVAPPRPWKTPFSGGYLTSVLRPRLVHTRNRDYLDELGGVDLSEAMAAVNAIQATPWKINRAVLDVLLEEKIRGGNCAGLPPEGDLPLPPRPVGIPEDAKTDTLTTSQREDLTVWKAKAAKVYAENASNEQERIILGQKLYVAQRFAEEEAIYFPHYLDFRGRVYPLAAYLNPQSDDVGRGLLMFAEGKPLGEDGAFWLAVHIAGLFGIDKVSMDERVAWTLDHEEEILDSAMDPHDGARWWTTADKPWQALAACFDWLGYKLNGDAHVSHLPIAMDGTCSGLQHYSALLLDEVGGAAVNLVPSDKPSDIYSMVAERAQVVSDGFLGSTNDHMARVWRGKVNRKVAKQPTMTLCYSATKFGMKGQIENALGKLDEGGKYLPGEDNYKAALYMSEIIWDSLGDVVVSARRAMKWLKDVSDVAVQADIPIRWTSPIGLPVLQDYRDSAVTVVVAFVGGRRHELNIREDGNKLSRRRQASGIAPNFVHSLDAAHLLSTVNLGVLNGLGSFAVIHDSFAVHAADTSKLNAVLRESFVQQYSEPVLQRFRDEIVSQLEAAKPELAAKIPPLPRLGNLDLDAVRNSEFFFA